MEKIFKKPLQDGWVEVVDSVETLEDGTEIKHTHREDNPAPNTYPKYAEAVKHWTAMGLTVYDRGDFYEFAEPEPLPEPSEAEKAQSRIDELKRNLAETDYISAKIADGVATREEYAKELKQREEWRQEIRRLEPICINN